jgi:acyl-CoA dehydrogenase
MRTDHLEWPFFDAEHRELATKLDAWATGHIDVDHAADVDVTCRGLVRSYGLGSP